MTDELKYRIRFTRGTLAGQLFPLGGEPVILGRSHTCSIRLMEPDVSARHVMLSVDSKGVGMEVISSRRTVLDGTALKTGDRVPVKAGQGVTMGGTASFEVECYLSDGDATEMPMGGDLPTAFRDGGETRKPGRGAGTPDFASAADSRTDPPSAAGMTGAKTRTSFRRKASAGDATYQATMGTQAVPPSIPPGDETAGTEAFGAGEATQVLRTRAATPQELAFMRSLHDRKRRKRLWMRLALALCLTGIACGVYAWLASHAPEQTLSIPPPADRKSWKVMVMEDAGLRPVAPGQDAGDGIFLSYPPAGGAARLSAGRENNPVGGGEAAVFSVRTRVGRALDVPLQLKLVAYASDASLDQDQEAAFEAWDRTHGPGIEKQTVLKTDFVGDNPGIPCLRWTYRRKATPQEEAEGVSDDWAGVLSFFRLHDTCFVYFREVPSNEKLRAEYMLVQTQTFLGINPSLVKARWAGMDKARQYAASLTNLRNSAKELMDKHMKAEWEETEDKLSTILILTSPSRRRAGDPNAERWYHEALNWMKVLRDRQEKAWKEARSKRCQIPADDRDGKGRQLDEDVRALFRSPDDRRTDVVRTKEKWWEQ